MGAMRFRFCFSICDPMSATDQKALALFSGGQDSATCLAWALSEGFYVETVGFTYGQRHMVEMEARQAVLKAMRARFPEWAAQLGDDFVVDLSSFGALSETALTGASANRRPIETGASGLPSTFVPGRNLVFLTYAAALAYGRGTSTLIGGMCETDFSGYPDCRDSAIKALGAALNEGMAAGFTIETPLMWIDKAETWRLAERLGGRGLVELIVEETHSCYLGERGVRHAWGYGCGTCPACELRAKGFAAYEASRP